MAVTRGSNVRDSVTGLLVCALLAVSVTASAQSSGQSGRQQANQPYRGLFGAGTPARPGGQSLDLTLSVYEEYGNEFDTERPTGPLVLEPGLFTGGRAGLSYEQAGRTVRTALRADGSIRYYHDIDEFTTPRYRVELAFDSVERPSSRRLQSTWHLGGSYEHEPYYILPLFPAGALTAGGTAVLPTFRDDLAYPNERDIFSQAFTFDRELNQRSTFSVFEQIRYTKGEAAVLDAQYGRAGARLGRRLSRYAALRLGYAYERGQYGTDTSQLLEMHNIDLSIDYRRPLPRMRRTTFGITTGTARITTGDTERWEVVGAVNLRREFDQGWFLQTDFQRNTRLVEGFSQPFLQNTVSGSLGGFMGRRLEALATGGYSRGHVGFGDARYRAVQAAGRLRLALSRHLALDGEGLLNRHQFDADVVTTDTIPARINRWSVRGNLTIWLPLSR